MSIYSTLHITETKAKALLFDEHFGQLSHEELGDKLDVIFKSRLNNVLVVSDDTTPNDDDQI